jgi:hypothetical protein
MYQQQIVRFDEIIKQKDIQIENLNRNLKHIENERNILIAQRGLNFDSKFLNDLETNLNELNLKLTSSKLPDNVFETFFMKLFDSMKQNSLSSPLKVTNLEKVKENLLKKIAQSLTRSKQYEIKNVELERKIEQISLEHESLKQAINCKQLYSQGELSVVCNELMKWKNEMKQLNKKAIEQNKLINLLVRKCENMRCETPISNTRPNQRNQLVYNHKNHHNFLTPPSSYETMDEPVTIISTNKTDEVLLQVYQCPKCKIEISNDIDFKVFTDHVDNCSPDKLVCVFCLKFFDKRNNDEFIDHVSSH